MGLILERVRMELGHLARKATGEKTRRRGAAIEAFEAARADLRPGDLAIDLGANIGLITETLAETGADVIAFEPDPHAFELLSARLAGRANVTLIQAAAAAQAGTLPLMRHRDFANDPDRRTVSSTLVQGKRRMEGGETVEVEVKDFVAYLHALNRPVKLLKIDIEGSEVALLERLLGDPVAARIGHVFVETHERAVISLAARTRALKRRAARMDRPVINWDWR
ncbi:FkbM family methyltransferase [Rhodovulum bhavnagarense]|uniref:FkbM family methyltransferase n=2 Tax=Rhodovulum bhavnagarense TaxID=992286 RepID=A0A4R2RC35_9RHOB|nr:FkbM family methyltransferase [Rhodovulum bhavnagarense]